VPALSSRITDLTGTLSGSTVNRVESEIAGLEATRGSRIAVLIVASTEPLDIEQYSARALETLRVGREAGGDSALLLVAKQDRRIRIEVGTGLARTLPANVANRILDEVIAPHFELGDFDGGVEAGVHQMIGVVNGASLPDPDRGWIPHRGLHRLATLLLGALLGAAIAFLAAVGLKRTRPALGAELAGPESQRARHDFGGASGRW
jgi:uncharacterized protein